MLFYVKMTEARDNILLIVVSLDPFHAQDAFVQVPVESFGFFEGQTLQVHDLLHDERYLWTGWRHFVRLTPERPAHIFRVRRRAHSEEEFENYV